jgi:hypothetical protein
MRPSAVWNRQNTQNLYAARLNLSASVSEGLEAKSTEERKKKARKKGV